MPDLTMSEVENILNNMGTRGKQVINVMAKVYDDIEVYLKTNLGKQILKEDILRTEELMVKVYKETATPEELAEFRFLRDVRLPRIFGKIKQYYDLSNEAKNKAREVRKWRKSQK
jgi:hypothetical protein